MEAERWTTIERICQAALDRAPDDRETYLAEACAGDESLRREVESLLAEESRAQNLIETPPGDLAAEMLKRPPSQPLGQPLLHRQIRHYQILSLLGAGGMGEVYLALDPRLKRKVALKTLPVRFTQDEERVRRFEREALATSALNHPNILTIYEIGESEGTHFIVAEYVEGETLRQRMKRSKLTPAETLKLAAQIAGALAVAHAAGVVHRDIKPENVMVRPDGLVKILDFGLAKLVEQEAATAAVESAITSASETASGMVLGTLRYMSPEQARGQKVDGRSDLFSLGVTLYEMIAGQPPFAGETSADLIAAILTGEPAPLRQACPGAPPALEPIIVTALRKNREERFPTAQVMLDALTSLQQELELAARLGQPLPPVSTNQTQEPVAVTGQIEVVNTGKTDGATTGRYLFDQLKRRRLAAALFLLAIVLAGTTAIFYLRHAPALTGKDLILLAEFSNLTGETAFDLTLKQALAVQLEQSPYLNIFPEERTRETLRFMNRAPDAPVTVTIGREICQRQGLKAMLTGTVAGVGNHYIITLQAHNGQTGDTMARVQTEAESKEQVLRKLGEAAAELREDLGESLRSVQQFNAPIEQGTTPSLEAFKAFSLGVEQQRNGKNAEAVAFYQRALELDPQFALAHARLSVLYRTRGETKPAVSAATQAFELRERVSQREQFEISLHYYNYVTGERDKMIEVARLFTGTYPHSAEAYSILGLAYESLGQNEPAIEAARAAMRLAPRSVVFRIQLAGGLLQASRIAEAREVLEQALAQKFDSPVLRRRMVETTFAQNDLAAYQQQLDWLAQKSLGRLVLNWQAKAEAFAGRLQKSRELYRRASELSARDEREDQVEQIRGQEALVHAVCGVCHQATDTKLDIAVNVRGTAGPIGLGLAQALCGQLDRAQARIDELVNAYPKDTVVNAIWVPTIQAAIESRRGNYARAIELLQSVRPYEAAAAFLPGYLRGYAYLGHGAGVAAAEEFQLILDHRGQSPFSNLYPLARLGLARAINLTGDTARSRQAYQEFLTLWRDADQDLPILGEAKRELGRLK